MARETLRERIEDLIKRHEGYGWAEVDVAALRGELALVDGETLDLVEAHRVYDEIRECLKHEKAGDVRVPIKDLRVIRSAMKEVLERG